MELTHEMGAQWAAFADKAAGVTKTFTALERTFALPGRRQDHRRRRSIEVMKTNDQHGIHRARRSAPRCARCPEPIERLGLLSPIPKSARAGSASESRGRKRAARWSCDGAQNIAPNERPARYAHVQDPGVTFEGRVLRLRAAPPACFHFRQR